MALFSPGPSEPAPPSMVLLLACLCTFMEGRVIALCMEQLASKFPGSGGGGGGDQPPAFVAGELARRINAAASGLLSSYVESHGRRLSLMVRRSVESTNWLKCKRLIFVAYDRRMDGWMHGQIDRARYGWMGGWIASQTDRQ
eukprot:scaffold334865_cov39-Prasinocladus_malaysianus.AAC.1